LNTYYNLYGIFNPFSAIQRFFAKFSQLIGQFWKPLDLQKGWHLPDGRRIPCADGAPLGNGMRPGKVGGHKCRILGRNDAKLVRRSALAYSTKYIYKSFPFSFHF
jgi:hypothetical protein